VIGTCHHPAIARSGRLNPSFKFCGIGIVQPHPVGFPIEGIQFYERHIEGIGQLPTEGALSRTAITNDMDPLSDGNALPLFWEWFGGISYHPPVPSPLVQHFPAPGPIA